jgi:hypothetical protein
MSPEGAATDVPSNRPRGNDRCSPDNVDCHQIIEGPPSVEHRHQATSWTKHSGDLRLGGNDVGDVVKDTVRKHQVEALVRERERCS